MMRVLEMCDHACVGHGAQELHAFRGFNYRLTSAQIGVITPYRRQVGGLRDGGAACGCVGGGGGAHWAGGDSCVEG